MDSVDVLRLAVPNTLNVGALGQLVLVILPYLLLCKLCKLSRLLLLVCSPSDCRYPHCLFVAYACRSFALLRRSQPSPVPEILIFAAKLLQELPGTNVLNWPNRCLVADLFGTNLAEW